MKNDDLYNEILISHSFSSVSRSCKLGLSKCFPDASQMPQKMRITRLRLRSSDYEARITRPRLQDPDYEAQITRCRRSPDYEASKAQIPRPQITKDYEAWITRPWSRNQAYACMYITNDMKSE